MRKHQSSRNGTGRRAIWRGFSALAMISFPVAVAGYCPAGEVITDEAIDRVGRQVLESSEFRSVRRRLMESPTFPEGERGFVASALRWAGEQLSFLGQRVADFFQWMFGDLLKPGPRGQTNGLGSDSWWGSLMDTMSELIRTMATFGSQTLVLLTLVVVVVLTTLVLARIIRRRDEVAGFQSMQRERMEELVSEITVAPGELPPAVYELRAVKLAAAGDYRSAIRELLLGSMSWLERSSLIRFRRGLTNRDYYRSIWRQQDKRRAWMATASQFELVYFGRRQPTQDMFEACLIEFQGAFREEETPTVSV